MNERTGQDGSTGPRTFLDADNAGVLHPVGGRVPAQCDHTIGGEDDASGWLVSFASCSQVVPTDVPKWEEGQAKL